jgi:hypothetical protein
MANDPVTVTTGADLIAGEVVANEFLMLLAERQDILNHPALFHATGKPGSNVVRVPHIGLGGYDLLSARTPGSEVNITDLADDKTDVTIAPYSKRYAVEDFMRFLVDGKLNAAAFAADLAIAYAQTLLYLLANIGDGFTSTCGSTGVNAAWSDIVDGKTKLALYKAAGPMLGLLHPQQWGDLETASLSLGGAAQHEDGLIGVVALGLGQYKGRVMGVDWFVTSHVPTANGGADRGGCIVTPGALVYGDVEYPTEADPNMMGLGRAMLERVRQGTYGQTSWMEHALLGGAMGIDRAGVSVITDA